METYFQAKSLVKASLDNNQLRIFDGRGQPVGVGLWVGGELGLTCWHVVNQAVPGAGLGALLSFDCPGHPDLGRLAAEVVFCDPEADLAGLKISADLPHAPPPLLQVAASEVWGHPFRAFGFPNGYADGVWATGRILGSDANGWLQIEETQTTGYAVQPGFSGGAIWDESLQGVVGMIVAADTRPGVRAAFVLPVDRLVRAWPELKPYITFFPTYGAEAAPGESPYMGLRYFDTGDAGLFFGREELTEKLAARLAQDPIVIIVGASGSGKSSLARAGLIPTWQCGIATSGGRLSGPVYVITPTAHPLERLAVSLTRDSELVGATAALIDDLGRDVRSLHLWVRKWGERSGEDHCLLLVDQFEEIFTLCKDARERKAWVDNLIYAISQPDGPLRVILTLRADFYQYCAEYEGLRQALDRYQTYIGPMSCAELRRAIEAPALAHAWTFQVGLVDLILQDVGQEPGALPLLAHALLETWQRREGRTLTLAGYTTAGGVRKAIAQTAENVYDQFSPEARRIARRIFLNLTELGESVQYTRRRVKLADLTPPDGHSDVLEGVLKALVAARLVILDHDSAEVAHEALIREWPTLQNWLDEGRSDLLIQRHLTQSAVEWQSRGCDPAELYRGMRLSQAENWARAQASEVGSLERNFLRAAREAVWRERRSVRLRWVGLVVVVGLVVLVVVLALTNQLDPLYQWVYPQPTIEWVIIREGKFLMGSPKNLVALKNEQTVYLDAQNNEQPVHSVYLDAFKIARFEVTNDQYHQCVLAKTCDPSGNSYYTYTENASRPVTNVSWQDAKDFCTWIGGRLPTEAEWEKAARGGKEKELYPWGSETPVCTRGLKNGAQFSDCKHTENADPTEIVGSFAPNGYGLYDMAGNAQEWVNDGYGMYMGYDLKDYDPPIISNPRGVVNEKQKISRGGSWNSNLAYIRVTMRSMEISTNRRNDLGFRCAISVTGEQNGTRTVSPSP
jgi:formylglycine-generating enzyme required for sulfatase activity